MYLAMPAEGGIVYCVRSHRVVVQNMQPGLKFGLAEKGLTIPRLQLVASHISTNLFLRDRILEWISSTKHVQVA